MKTCNENLLTQLLDYIQAYQKKNGKSPSYRNIMKTMRFSSLSMVFRYVGVLESRGQLQKDNLGGIDISYKFRTNRTINAPLVGTVTCGTPILAYENIEGTYTLPADIFGTGDTMILHAKGDSMINAGIKDKDFLVVKICNNADDGEIVVARIDNEATVKRLFRRNGKIILHPENENYKDIILDKVEIEGVVVSSIHNFK